MAKEGNEWVPVIVAIFLFICTYCLFAIFLCLIKLIIQDINTSAGIVFLVIFHILFFMVAWCMIQVIRTDPGTPKEKYASIYDDTIISRPDQEFRYPFSYTECALCRFPKPYRSFHCRECERCHLKMDHRCPWVNNCIGFYNYKYFYLFMFYITIFGYFVAIVLIVEGIEFLGLQNQQNTAYPYIFLGYSGFTFMIISSPTFILFYHTYLMLYNKTTIENIREGNESCYNQCLHRHSSIPLNYNVKDYNLGYRLNFVQVMGSNPLLWLVPIYSSQGSGFVFPKKSSFEDQITTNKTYSV